MRLARLFLIAALVVPSSAVVAACGGSQKEVEMKGPDADLAAIAGDWEGSYTGHESGRSGPVEFSLQLGRHTAEGTVLMGGATPLKIEFVKVEGGKLSGKIGGKRIRRHGRHHIYIRFLPRLIL